MNSHIPRWATRERQFWKLSPELLSLAVEPVRRKRANPTMVPHPKTDTYQPVAANTLEENLVPTRGHSPCAGEHSKTVDKNIQRAIAYTAKFLMYAA